MKIALTIPIYVNNVAHRNYLEQTVKSFSTSHELIFIPVINYLNSTFDFHPYKFTQEPAKTIELLGREPEAVSKAWNDGIAKGVEEGCEYILILNEDIILAKSAIDNLVAFAEANREDNVLWSMAEHTPLETLDVQTGGQDGLGPHFSAFMVHKSFPEIVGKFDEHFVPAYFEDNDIHTRIIKLGKWALRCKDARFFHFGSVVLKSDPDYQVSHPKNFQANEAYFISKWGGKVMNTKDEMLRSLYPTPFNDPNKGINDW